MTTGYRPVWGTAPGLKTSRRMPPPPGRTMAGLAGSKPHSRARRWGAAAIGVQGVRLLERLAVVRCHPGCGAGVEGEVHSPETEMSRGMACPRWQSPIGAKYTAEHALERDAHGVHQVRLQVIHGYAKSCSGVAHRVSGASHCRRRVRKPTGMTLRSSEVYPPALLPPAPGSTRPG